MVCSKRWQCRSPRAYGACELRGSVLALHDLYDPLNYIHGHICLCWSQLWLPSQEKRWFSMWWMWRWGWLWWRMWRNTLKKMVLKFTGPRENSSSKKCRELNRIPNPWETKIRENTRQRKTITHTRQYLRGSAIYLRPRSCKDLTIIREEYRVQPGGYNILSIYI